MSAAYRHELKYIIYDYQYEELKSVLNAMLDQDKHSKLNGQYLIRSLYFDDLIHSAYNQREDGYYVRKKYRIRIYDYSDSLINLECKHKRESYIFKESLKLSKEEYHSLLNDDLNFLLDKNHNMAKDFYIESKTNLIKPAVIVDYEREAYVYDVGTVRITFDKNVRAAYKSDDIFNKEIPTYFVLKPNMMILEIKFTDILPEQIRKIFKVRNYTQTAASKYCMCVDKMREFTI
ncbi:polyphosphate polymerase domain-containing protein [Lachnotalea glycerini]|uniref:VTC domain-containing protein n=1 Tax=Lachnotalea glycerini TaxID=1763509 RepID=A0A371JCC7_9FIRM|nr:polyphosphate polymerase domain-containing protein [Lachnotalea glycerini]RDY30338.1 VTC domain-containing protein [Lachnotalea glycerini]